jgi:hypothetical protein
VLATGAAVLACSPDQILEVTDPDIINPAVVADAAGANALRIGALARFNSATSGNENLLGLSGVMTDEFRSSDTFSQRNETDQRRVQTNNANITSAQRDAQGARISAIQAAAALRTYSPTRGSEIAEMYLVQGYMENLFAETLCSGIPLTTPEELGVPLPTPEVYARALAHADSAIAAVVADAAGARVLSAARILKGRILVNQGQYAQAAAAVAGVATDFRYNNEHSQSTRVNAVWNINNNSRRFTLVDREGGIGLDFISANDPRLPISAVARGGGFDGTSDLYRQQLYPAAESPFNLISGIEARLIEAEALLATDPSGALARLNQLRAGTNRIGGITVAGLPALTQQASTGAQVDQLFRERAFWMFASGHRLGDLRRLIRQYGRSESAVFPTGSFFKGGTYGTDVNLPVTQPEENNPHFTGCLDRNA